MPATNFTVESNQSPVDLVDKFNRWEEENPTAKVKNTFFQELPGGETTLYVVYDEQTQPKQPTVGKQEITFQRNGREETETIFVGANRPGWFLFRSFENNNDPFQLMAYYAEKRGWGSVNMTEGGTKFTPILKVSWDSKYSPMFD